MPTQKGIYLAHGGGALELLVVAILLSEVIQNLLALEEEVVTIKLNVSGLHLWLLVLLSELIGELLAGDVRKLRGGREVVQVGGEAVLVVRRSLVELWDDNIGIGIPGQVDRDSSRSLLIDKEAIKVALCDTDTGRGTVSSWSSEEVVGPNNDVIVVGTSSVTGSLGSLAGTILSLLVLNSLIVLLLLLEPVQVKLGSSASVGVQGLGVE